MPPLCSHSPYGDLIHALDSQHRLHSSCVGAPLKTSKHRVQFLRIVRRAEWPVCVKTSEGAI